MVQKLAKFVLVLSLVVAVVYILQRLAYHCVSPLPELTFLHFSYKFNLGFTLLFTMGLILISRKLKDQLGFVFMLMSVIKLGLLLFLVYRLGFDLNKSKFLIFFVPYGACLVVEMVFIIRILKHFDSSSNH